MSNDEVQSFDLEFDRWIDRCVSEKSLSVQTQLDFLRQLLSITALASSVVAFRIPSILESASANSLQQWVIGWLTLAITGSASIFIYQHYKLRWIVNKRDFTSQLLAKLDALHPLGNAVTWEDVQLRPSGEFVRPFVRKASSTLKNLEIDLEGRKLILGENIGLGKVVWFIPGMAAALVAILGIDGNSALYCGLLILLAVLLAGILGTAASTQSPRSPTEGTTENQPFV